MLNGFSSPSLTCLYSDLRVLILLEDKSPRFVLHSNQFFSGNSLQDMLFDSKTLPHREEEVRFSRPADHLVKMLCIRTLGAHQLVSIGEVGEIGHSSTGELITTESGLSTPWGALAEALGTSSHQSHHKTKVYVRSAQRLAGTSRCPLQYKSVLCQCLFIRTLKEEPRIDHCHSSAGRTAPKKHCEQAVLQHCANL